MKQEIVADINPRFMDHFKSQLMQYEVTGSEVKVLYDGGGHQDRHELMTDLVERSFNDIPTPKRLRFWVFTGDNRPVDVVNDEPLFSIAGPRIRSEYVIPDPYVTKWTQAGVDNFESYCEIIRQNSLKSPTKNAAVWRGLASQNPVRKFIVERCATLKRDIYDVKDTQPDCNDNDFVHMKDLPNWSVLVDMPGQGFSGRLKYLLHAHRPMIVFQRLDWDAVTMLLEPGIHYLSCPPDSQVFEYLVHRTLLTYEETVRSNFQTVQIMKKITCRDHVSQLLVNKVKSAVL